MPLREPDHKAVRDWLGALEAGKLDTKSAAMLFSAFAGGSYGAPYTSWWGDGTGNLFGPLLPGSQYDYVSEAGDLWSNSAVAACMGWISDNFSEPVLRVYARKADETEETPIPDHPLVQALEEPNPDYGSDDLWMATILSYLVSGNGFWIKAKAPSRNKLWVYYVPHWEIRACWSTDGKSFITHYEHVVDGTPHRLEKTDVVHFRHGLDPRNIRSGLPQLMPVLREIVADNAANTYTAAILRNMGIPGVLIQPEDDNVTIGTDEAENIKQKFIERTSGDNAGKPLVNSVRLKLQELTLSPEKLTLDKIRRIPEARICAALKIPPTVVGLSVGKDQRSYANSESDERKAYRNCLIPLQKSFAKVLTKQLLPDLQTRGAIARECVRWDYSLVEAMNEERTAVADRSTKLFLGGLGSFEEQRHQNGLGPAKKGDTFFAPKGGTTYKFGEEPDPAPAAGGTPPPDAVDETGEETNDEAAAAEAKSAAIPDDAVDRALRVIAELERRLEVA